MSSRLKKENEMSKMRLFRSENVPSESEIEELCLYDLREDKEEINRLEKSGEFKGELNVVTR